ncbi:hypothetical protein FSP39_009951 [Pinctada imbricata]|uniref:Uncharacterized protein n=1 Tax=Pinctada imbricata TaxID=66713 RepID=A0AA89C9V5_PINIB|nr:hypothetical protein FSP39_009951 [Pinctada imbricata]
MRRNKSSKESYESSSREVGSVESGEVMPNSGEVDAYSKTDDDNGGNGDKKRRMNRMKAAVTKILMLSKQRRLKLTPKAMKLIAKWIRMYKDLNSKTKHNTMARKNKKSAHNSLKSKGSHKPKDYVSTSTSVEIIQKVKGKSKSSVASAKSESVTGQTGVKMTTNDGTVSKLQIHPMAGNPVIATEKVEISGKLHAAGIQILNHGQTSTTTIENNDTGDIESLSTKGDQPAAIDKNALGIIVPLESLREGDNPTSSKILKVQNAANQSPSESLFVESTNIDEGASQNNVRGIPVQLFDQSPKVKTSLGKAAESTIAEQRLREGKRLRAILQRMAMARQLRKRLMERERAASSTNIDKASSAEISSSAGPKSFIMNSIDTFTNRKPKTTHVRKRRSVPQNVQIMKLSRGKRHLALLQPGGIFVNGNLGTFGVQSIMSSSINPTNVLGGIPIQVNTGQVNPPSYAFMNQQNQQTLFVPQYKKPSSSSYDKKPVSSYDKKPVSSSYDKKPIQTYGISNHMGHPQKSQVINNLSGFQSLSPLGGSVSHHMAGNMMPAGGGLVVHSGSQMNPPHTVAISNQMSNSGMISGSHISHANVIHAPPQISQPAVVHQPLPPGSRLPNINFDKVNSGLARNPFLTKSVEVPQTPGKPKIHIHLSINPKTYGKKSPKKQIYEKQGNGFLQENSLSISPQDYGAVSQFIEQGSYDKVESPQSLVGSLSSSSHFHSSSSLGSPQGGGFLVSQPSSQGTQGGIFSQTQVVQPEQKRPKFIQISKQIMQKPVIVQTSEPAISLNPPLPPPVAVQLPPPPPPPPLPMLPFQSPPPPSPPSPIVPMRPDPVSVVVKQEMSMNGDGSILSNIPFMGSQTENIDALGGGLGIDIAGGAFYDGVAQPAFKLPKVLEKPNESPYIDVINQVESQVSQIINNELAPQMDLTGIKDITQGLSSNSISGGGQFSNIVVNNGLSSQNIVEQPVVINKDPITPENSYNNGLSQIGSQGLNSIDSAVIEGQGTSIMNNALSMPSLQSQGQEVINSGLSSQNSFNNIQVVESGFNSPSQPSVGSILSATSFVGSNGQNNGNGFNIFDNSFAAEGWNPPTKVKSNMKVKTDTASLSSTNQIDKLEAAVDGVIGASLSNSYEKQTNSISNMHDAIQNEIMNFVPESNPFIPEVKAEPETYDKKIDAFGNTIDSYDKKPEMFGNALDSYDKKIDSFGNSLGSYDKKSESYDKKVESYDKKIESYDKKVETFVEKKAESYDKKMENIEQGILNQNQLDRRTTSLSFGQLSPPGQYEGFIVGDPYNVPGYDNTPEPPRASLTNKVDTSKGIAVPFFDSFVSSVSNSKPAADTSLNVGRLNGVSNDMSVKSFNLWMKPTEPPASRWIPPPPPSPPPPPQPTPAPTQPPTPPPAMIYTQTSPAASRYSRTSLSQQFIVSSSGLDQGTFSKDTQNQERIGQNVLDKVDFGQNELNQDIFSQIALNQGSLSQNSLNQGGLSQNSLNQGGFSQNALNQGRISQNSLNQGGFSQNLLNQGSISQNSFNQESISQNLFNQGSISQNSLNQGSISQNSLNQGSISQNSLNQGSISQNSLNQGSLSQNSLNQGSFSKSVFNEGSFSPGPWNKESTNQDSFSQNSLNLGGFSQNSLGGGSFSQNSLGGGSFSQNSLGGGSFSQNSLGGGSFSQNSLGGGSFSQNSLGGGSFSENTFVKENSYAKESTVENNNFEPVVQGSLQGSLGSPSRDMSRDIPLFNAGGGQVYDQGFNEPSVDTNLNSLSTGFKSHKSQIAFTVDRPTQVEQIQKTTVPTTTAPTLGFQKGGGFIVSDFGSNGFNLGGGFSLSSFGKNIRNNHNSWTQKQEGVSNQQQENKQNDFFSGGLSGGLSSFGSDGNAGSLMGDGQFHNSHKQTSYKIANDNKMHSSIDSSMSSLSAHSHAVVVKR